VSLMVEYETEKELLEALDAFDGQLTATLHSEDKNSESNQLIIEKLSKIAGRVIFNGFPTGVEVCHSMVHGGPYPATSDGRSTSVGPQAIFRFTRPISYQSFPQSQLPEELQDDNPKKIRRIINGVSEN
jgi:2,5-dioxopentanoate dehydrogenase